LYNLGADVCAFGMKRAPLALAIVAGASALLLVARLGHFMWSPANVGSSLDAGRDPFLTGHNCLGSYYTGIVMLRNGENPYDWVRWESVAGKAFPGPKDPPPEVDVRPFKPDAVPNNPPFLLQVVRALQPAEASPHALFVLRWRWFGLELALAALACLALAMALWRESPWSAAICASMLGSFVWRLNLQYGQSQIFAMALVVAAAAAFAARRDLVGGIALGTAICFHLTPAFIVLPLLTRRRWTALVATGATIAVVALMSIATQGWEIHRYYFLVQLPELMRGGVMGREAFARIRKDIFEMSGKPFIVDNISAWATTIKLYRFGLHASVELANLASKLFGYFVYLVVLASAWWVRDREMTRMQEVALYLGVQVLILVQNPHSPTYTFVVPALLAGLMAVRPGARGASGLIDRALHLLLFVALGWVLSRRGFMPSDAVRPRIVVFCLTTATLVFLGARSILYAGSSARASRSVG
jgi:hypothetical protein